jgi:hypothetical protein
MKRETKKRKKRLVVLKLSTEREGCNGYSKAEKLDIAEDAPKT